MQSHKTREVADAGHRRVPLIPKVWATFKAQVILNVTTIQVILLFTSKALTSCMSLGSMEGILVLMERTTFFWSLRSSSGPNPSGSVTNLIPDLLRLSRPAPVVFNRLWLNSVLRKVMLQPCLARI
ncbi:hypothetical protein V8G54_021548 [Vigna mungo]|uniref:Uncharacterized protein n=1 Tax=Vigna mungo TaxID=3915 RepID=A0AAQ3NEJ4_VIGMU